MTKKITADSIAPVEAGMLLLASYGALGFDARGYDTVVNELVEAGLLERNPTADRFVRVTEAGEELLAELYDAHGFGEEDDD